MKKKIFCAHEQAETDHTFTVESDEVVARCDTCGRMLKFPPVESKAELDAMLDAHREANQGHIPAPTEESVARELKKLEALLAD